MPTISDVSRLAGVSKTTVSRVLNAPELVNRKTRERVLGVIKKLDYAPSMIARGMRGQKTRMIGVIIPDFTNLYYSEFLKHVEECAIGEGYLALICSTEANREKEKEFIEMLRRRQIEGLILCRYEGVKEDEDFFVRLARDIPIVITDQASRGLPLSAVLTDSRKGIRTLTAHLIERGCRKIAILGGRRIYPFAVERFGGYTDALNAAGIALDERLCEECDCTADGGYRAAERILNRVLPEAFVAVTDLIAIGALRCIQSGGYAVPGDIALGGFDNILLSLLTSPRLTTVEQPIEEIAREAVGQLIRKVRNKRVRNRDIVLENRLIVRESTGAVKREKVLD
jgi:DNA-binding LacI/PurR family transcriptional regulator